MARGASYLAVPLVALAVFGCRVYDFAEREPWRNEAEQRCLATRSLQSSKYLEPAAEVGRFGQCGMTQPFKVAAIGDGTLALARDETRPQSFAARIQSVLGVNRVAVSTRDRTPVQPVAIEPRPTLACPLITAIDRWMLDDVQPAATAWFGEAVVEVRQLSSYACRPINGQPGARISEHAFGNALDVAAFRLASGREVTVKDGWRGAADERGFLRQIHAAACERFSTVLGPGADAFHYDHFHLDLARRANGTVCKPVPQEVAPPAPTSLRTAERTLTPAPAPTPKPTPKPSWPPSPAERLNDPYSISARTAPTRADPRPVPAPALVQRTPAPAIPQRTPAPDALFANQPLAQLPPAHLSPPAPVRPAPALPAPRTLPAPARAAGEPLDLTAPRIAVPQTPVPPAPVHVPAAPVPRPALRPPAPIPTAGKFDPTVTGSVTTKRFYKDAPAPIATLPPATPGED